MVEGYGVARGGFKLDEMIIFRLLFKIILQ